MNAVSQQAIDTVLPAKLSNKLAVDSLKIQVNTDSVKKGEQLFSNHELKKIDSLLLVKEFNALLVDSVQYVLADKDIKKDISGVLISSTLLKEDLAKLNETTPLNLEYNPALERVIKSYLKYRKKYYPALMARAAYYFPMFEQYLDQYDIPLEIKYLSIVESALRPRAVSYVGATGLWQFMYNTGKQFDLKVSSYVDERRDPLKSTIAACKYLSYLYSVFSDWDLALAAYNSGPGNVLKAIRRSGGHKNYWNIRPFLPRETAGYLPAFYATMYIFEHAEKLGLQPEKPITYSFKTDTIRIKRTLSFDHIAKQINLDKEFISFLNPSYKLAIIPFVKNRNYEVRLPKNKVMEFLEKEQEIYAFAAQEEKSREKPLPRYFEMDKRIRYRVRSGDYLGKIANKFRVRIKDLKRWNGLRSNKLRIGQRLTVYPKRL